MTLLAATPTPLETPAEALVRRHLDMVYAAALRQVRDPHLAADVTQAVFLIFHQKLPRLGNDTLWPVWLLRTTRYASLAALRRQRRRTYHERKAQAMRQETQDPSPPENPCLAFLDEALDRLSKTDRALIVQVYFLQISHPELARRLKITPDATHKRVQRAVNKLRTILARRGLTVPAATITSALFLAAQPSAAPAAVTHAVLCTSSVPAAIHTLAQGTLTMMKLLHIKFTALLIAGFLAATITVIQIAHAQVDAQSPATPNTAPPSPQSQSFATAVTLTVNDDAIGNDFTADLDAGTTLTPPRESDRGPLGVNHAAAHLGIDVTYERSIRALVGFDLTITPAPSSLFFDQPDPQFLLSTLIMATPATPAMMALRPTPNHFCFRTREGAVGILRIAASTEPDAPPSITLQYKLLTPEARNRFALQLATQRLLPEVQKHFDRFQSTTPPEKGAAGDLARSAAALQELLKGTPAAQPVAELAAIAHVLTFPTTGQPDARPTRDFTRALTIATKAISLEASKLDQK